MKKNVGGRPPVPGDKREKLVPCYLTKATAEKLRKYAEAGGFKGTSTLLTAIVEPIVEGGLSVQSAARSLNRVQKYMEKNGAPFGVSWKILKEAGRDLFAPPPPIPDDVEDLSRLKADLRALLAELENQTEPQTTSKK
jgi:hypothetical protein